MLETSHRRRFVWRLQGAQVSVNSDLSQNAVPCNYAPNGKRSHISWGGSEMAIPLCISSQVEGGEPLADYEGGGGVHLCTGVFFDSRRAPPGHKADCGKSRERSLYGAGDFGGRGLVPAWDVPEATRAPR